MWRLSLFKRLGGKDAPARSRPKRKRESSVNAGGAALWLLKSACEAAGALLGAEVAKVVWGLVAGAGAGWVSKWLLGQ